MNAVKLVKDGGTSILTRAAQVAALCLLTAGGAAAQSSAARPHCTPVGGSAMTNFLAPDFTLGTATGDLRGAISATLLGVAEGPGGTTVFTVQHHWTTDAGDRIDVDVAVATATQIMPGVFAILSYPLKIVGGTGRFAGAAGRIRNIGTVDLNTQRTIFRYAGDVCFQTPPK